jgi:hypothetical protein
LLFVVIAAVCGRAGPQKNFLVKLCNDSRNVTAGSEGVIVPSQLITGEQA